MISPSASSALITTTIVIIIVIAPMLGADCMREFSSLPHTIIQLMWDVYVSFEIPRHRCVTSRTSTTAIRAGSSWSSSSHSFVVAAGLARGGWRAAEKDKEYFTLMIPKLLNTIDSRRLFADRAGMCGLRRTSSAEPVCLSVPALLQGCSRVILVERDGKK